ncbi:MAG: transketolase C-terminal domain-containing protein [Sedimenticola sp.]
MMSYGEAIREGLIHSMDEDPSVILIGEGVPDPKGIFGTTTGLRERYGGQRVFDMPLSENAMTGICIGASLNGMRPVMVHQRIDFSLLAFDQIVNNAAKLRFLFDNRVHVPIVIRLIIGRGWGQGPQHGQSLQALFGHIPGLKVAMPATANDAKGMMIAAIEDDDPVIFIEHRWLHHTKGLVDKSYRPEDFGFGSARVVTDGSHLTVATFSVMLIEALKAERWLRKLGVELEVIDMRTVTPLDADTVSRSLEKTGQLIVVDTGHEKGGVAADLVSSVVRKSMSSLKSAPDIIALPNSPLPTSHYLADHYYPDAADIAEMALLKVGISCEREKMLNDLRRSSPRDQPDRTFTGPF